MARNFQGYKDKSAVILKNVFPDSNLVVSTPVEFTKKTSGVYIDGDPFHQAAVYEYLKDLVGIRFNEKYFGRWIGVFPPDEESPRIVIHYEAEQEVDDKLQLLSFVLPRHLATICNLRLSWVSELIVRIEGEVVQEQPVILAGDFPNGEIALSGGGGRIQLIS